MFFINGNCRGIFLNDNHVRISEWIEDTCCQVFILTSFSRFPFSDSNLHMFNNEFLQL